MQTKMKEPPCRRREKYTVGLDLGDRSSRYCVLDHAGEVIEEGCLKTNRADLLAYFQRLPLSRVAIEVGAHSRWVNHLLREIGHEVIVANPRNVHLISASTRKTDKVDAHTLARLARVDPSLLCPVRHRSHETQSELAIIRARNALVAARTQLINCLRGLVKSTGERLPPCSSESFAAKVAGFVPADLQAAAKPLLDQIASLSTQIRAYDRSIERLADSDYPETIALRTVPGIGALTALTFVLTIEDPYRFARSRDIGCYLGFRPKQCQSGQSAPQLGISKTGDCYLRKLLVGSAHYVLGKFGPDCDLRRWGLALASHGGKNGKKRAVVAVARKLAVLLHRLWISRERFRPTIKSPEESVHAA